MTTSTMEAERRIETVRDLPHVWVGRERLGGGEYQYVKRWKTQDMPWAEYWPVREHSLLVRLAEGDIRHVVDVTGIDSTVNEVRTRDAGISLDRLERRVLVKGESAPYPHPFFDIVELLKLMRWMLVALEEIHRLGLVHCDLSAGNVCLPLVAADDGTWHLDYSRVKLIDFAFALHRHLPLKYPLPIDTSAPELFFLPPVFRAAIARDQREKRAIHAQRAMNPGIDLYSLGAITQNWYWAGYRPQARIPAAAVEALFRRLSGYGGAAFRFGWWRADDRPLRQAIERLLARTDTDLARSPDFRFLPAETRTILARTAITPLVTRVRSPLPDRAASDATAPAVAHPHPNTAGGLPALAAARPPIPVATAAARRISWRRALQPLVVAGLGAALFLTDVRVDAPPPAPAEMHASELNSWVRALSAVDGDRRSASARELVRLAGAGGQGAQVAERLSAHLVERLQTGAANADAATQHAAAWTALDTLVRHGGQSPVAQAARRAMGEYERHTEELHRRLGPLVYDHGSQARAPDWDDYVLRLTTLAHAGSPRGALLLGLIARSAGRPEEAFGYLRTALLWGDERHAAGEEIGRLLQGLVDATDRPALTAIVADVEAMAAQEYPGWQIWAARINDVLGKRGKAASWYRRVSENETAQRAERDYARSAMARLSPRR